jgi:glucose uptake protein GlcU
MRDLENLIKRATFDTIIVTTLWSIANISNIYANKSNPYSIDIIPQCYTMIAIGTSIMVLAKYYT